ncbi:hypothetical protein H2200_004183 [Cladophialophora chaetospira]|uniref:Peptidase A1 domain-containing protein n=1 Tax=Cladophialophora chaetospira TaxID=386627 RepID=A0AA38XGA8_9EURO|nr:hypothetical protein H2200_004183 [Cladophialophora chaetospira]
MVAISAALQAALLTTRPYVYTTDLRRNGLHSWKGPPASTFLFTDLAFGSQSFSVYVDTSSAETWLASSSFICDIDGKTHPQADCNIGPLYTLDEDFARIPGRIFRQRYAPMIASGFPGTVPVTIAGLTTTTAASVAENLHNPGLTRFASGLVGLGFSPMTGDWTADSIATNFTHIPTKSLLTSLFEQHKISPQFAVSISRPSGKEVLSYGGVLTIGGLPHLEDPKVNATDDFASASFETYDSSELNETTHGLPLLADYVISVEGIYYGALGNMSVNSKPAQYLLDCGSPGIKIPIAHFNNWLAMFNPPLQGGAENEVSCSAPVPEFKFKIGGKLFPINPADLVQKWTDGRCYQTLSGSDGSGAPPYLLGDLFYRNVVAVHDWEKLEMR